MMADERLEQELSLARRAAPVFGLGRQQRVIWGVRRRLQPVKFAAYRAVVLIAAACLASMAASYLLWLRPRATEMSATQPRREERWELRDGSQVVLETPDTRVTKQREVESEVIFDLAAGAARFDVAHRPKRVFRVQAGAVDVRVIGTAFRVERRGAGALVSVERGRVRVSWASSSTVLAAGEHGVFVPPEASAVAPEPASTPSALPAPPSTRPTPAANVATATSSAVVASAPRSASAEELFAAADRARAAGHSLEAAQSLRELTQHFPRDGRAPLAAFTLGRLLLERLHQPADAAKAFAQARALSGSGSALAEDALAREAEAWRAAGSSAEAAKRAELYRTLYPNGARLKQVLRAGALSSAQ